MKRRYKKYRSLSPPINFWLVFNLILIFVLVISIFALIKERLFLEQNKILLEKYKNFINAFNLKLAQLNNSHLPEPTSPNSTSQIIYITKENFTLR